MLLFKTEQLRTIFNERCNFIMITWILMLHEELVIEIEIEIVIAQFFSN